jgi:hypothetical protein
MGLTVVYAGLGLPASKHYTAQLPAKTLSINLIQPRKSEGWNASSVSFKNLAGNALIAVMQLTLPA